jgi:hypothetical protein
MKAPLILVAAIATPLLSGCLATFEGQIDNNLACTVARDKLFMVSEWGPVGISTKIRKADTEAVCNPKQPVPAAVAPVAAASGVK